MNQSQAKKLICLDKNVDPLALKMVNTYQYITKVFEWVHEFCQENMCFSNAMNVAMVDRCDAVTGCAIHNFSTFFFHAWNRDSEGDFDLTRDIFLDPIGKENIVYFELVHFPYLEVARRYDLKIGIDHETLARETLYKTLFNYK